MTEHTLRPKESHAMADKPICPTHPEADAVNALQNGRNVWVCTECGVIIRPFTLYEDSIIYVGPMHRDKFETATDQELVAGLASTLSIAAAFVHEVNAREIDIHLALFAQITDEQLRQMLTLARHPAMQSPLSQHLIKMFETESARRNL